MNMSHWFTVKAWTGDTLTVAFNAFQISDPPIVQDRVGYENNGPALTGCQRGGLGDAAAAVIR